MLKSIAGGNLQRNLFVSLLVAYLLAGFLPCNSAFLLYQPATSKGETMETTVAPKPSLENFKSDSCLLVFRKGQGAQSV